jgi:hypothetical protein
MFGSSRPVSECYAYSSGWQVREGAAGIIPPLRLTWNFTGFFTTPVLLAANKRPSLLDVVPLRS